MRILSKSFGIYVCYPSSSRYGSLCFIASDANAIPFDASRNVIDWVRFGCKMVLIYRAPNTATFIVKSI
jgi:hypothetical protein